jgi:hypothetical protein
MLPSFFCYPLGAAHKAGFIPKSGIAGIGLRRFHEVKSVKDCYEEFVPIKFIKFRIIESFYSNII